MIGEQFLDGFQGERFLHSAGNKPFHEFPAVKAEELEQGLAIREELATRLEKDGR